VWCGVINWHSNSSTWQKKKKKKKGPKVLQVQKTNYGITDGWKITGSRVWNGNAPAGGNFHSNSGKVIERGGEITIMAEGHPLAGSQRSWHVNTCSCL
jgi:hypothetical protein